MGEIYAIVGVFIFVAGAINALWIKGGNSYFRENAHTQPGDSEEINTHHEPAIKEKLKQIFADMKTNKWIIVALMLSLLGSADFYILTTIFVIYIKSFYPNTEQYEHIAN
mmetsp:Transcript_20330/g.17608  ORF Transcript_20330/g.17608 Transcript_20330/m.17608 type:complete len:110 (+) Transcript_20330:53-382(+)